MPVDTTAIRKFLEGLTSPVVEIETVDLLKLLDAADRKRDPSAPRVPCVGAVA